MAWLDLVTPSAAILGLFAAVGLIIVAIRQGRAIRRLEERLARQGEAATPAPLQRIAELQARQKVSSGTPSLERQMRMVGAIVLAALVIVLAIGGIWYLFVRGDGNSGATAQEPAAATSTSTTGTAPTPPNPADSTLVPSDVPSLSDPSQYTVAVFNASGVTGIARTVVAPALQNEGFEVPTSLVTNPPDGATDRAQSVVMWTKGNKRVAWNVAKVLGIKRAPPLDGYTPAQVGNAAAIVLVGKDLAPAGTATP
jgi:LytR cell envelope-related transcriptional attenuator